MSKTKPAPSASAAPRFDVADLYRGPADPPAGGAADPSLAARLRQVYAWIVSRAVIGLDDLDFHDAPPQTYVLGDSKARLELGAAESYASFVLIPLLNFMVRRRCLLVGLPGRGKTMTAILMGALVRQAGGARRPIAEVWENIQHGHPQMTVSDLLGNPLPADLINARSLEEIRVAWRPWLDQPVKIVDEYNRIPTRTQSALLTVMADNYAEVLGKLHRCPKAAWYLTANDDAGGGTYQVIEALRDRIDIVVKAPHLNNRFLDDLLERFEQGYEPGEHLPEHLLFTAEEVDQVNRAVTAEVALPPAILRRIGFFASQLEFCEPAAEQLEYRTKDTVQLAGADVGALLARESGKDRLKDLGTQTRNGVSTRALLSLFAFAKALAYFRGRAEVALEDVRVILPFVLYDKLTPNLNAAFFDQPEAAMYRTDRLGWVRKLFDLACAEFDRLNLDREDP
ncbi:MAG: AAA family ATPase, partial [Anaerolineales bacterium]|nr:AAA family ATPase [Anaerolineales bacterium]